MSRLDLIWACTSVVGVVLIIAVMLINSAIEGTLLFFTPSPDGPSWATVVLAVMGTMEAAHLWRHYRSKAEGGAP